MGGPIDRFRRDLFSIAEAQYTIANHAYRSTFHPISRRVNRTSPCLDSFTSPWQALSLHGPVPFVHERIGTALRPKRLAPAGEE